MKTRSKNFKSAMLSIALAVLTVFAAIGIVFGGGMLNARAVTADEAAAITAKKPNEWTPITEIGVNDELANRNFADGEPISRMVYGGPWAFANIKDTVGWDKDDYTEYIAQYSTYRVVDVNDAVEGMGKISGKGTLVDTALEITINTTNQTTLEDSLTYSQLDDLMYGGRASDALYFSAWIKAEQDMWFDVGISYGAKADHAQVYFDLGRRFFVKAGEWVQIGKDENGNYLPFRAKVTEDGFLRGTGADPTAANSNCSTAETYAKEDMGDTQVGAWYRPSWGEVWACIRLYAYSGETYGTTGVGIPAVRHGLNAGDKYLVTGVNFWGHSYAAPVVDTEATGITLDKTTANMKVGDTLTLKATVTPDNATDKTVYWSSSDETIATVDQEGKVTAKKDGKVTITAEANGGAGVEASCAITVGATSTAAEPEKKGCGSQVGAFGFGALALVLIGGALILAIRKKQNA